MVRTPVYLDNHATTRVDPRVVDAMLPFMTEHYGNAGSTSHSFGWEVKAAVDRARETVAQAIKAGSREIVFTSGATESNNLAIRGLVDRRRRRGNHIVSLQTEHKAVLDPLTRLSHRDINVTLLSVEPNDHPQAGRVRLEQVANAITNDTMLVSVMLANNEIGVIQQLPEIAAICQDFGVPLHTDATQAVGKISVNVDRLGVDLMSFSAHKFYGPKGVGVLYVRRRGGRLRLSSQIEGGGQEGGLRSGTLNVPGIVGCARALELCCTEMKDESTRLAQLRDRLYEGLTSEIDDVALNGPPLNDPSVRLTGNLNCSFALVDGEALMMSIRDVAVSSGSACTSANPEPSHVLRALGLDADRIRSSLRFGIGRFNKVEEIDFAVGIIAEAVHRLRRLSSLG